jgi:hypothetical protein
MDSLHQVPVEWFYNAIVLWSVMGGELLLCPMFLEESHEVITHVFASLVRTESVNCCAILSVCPCCKRLVGHWCLWLSLESSYPHMLGVVISECDVVSLFANAVDWGWSPHVWVDFFSKGSWRWGLSLRLDHFSGQLNIFTRVTRKGCPFINKIYTLNGIVLDEGMEGVDADVAQVTVEYKKHDTFVCHYG